MGTIKELMLEEQEREAIAEDIAVEAGILKRCPWHERVYQEDWDLERGVPYGRMEIQPWRSLRPVL